MSDEELLRGEVYEADKQRERRDQVFAELIIKECAKLRGAEQEADRAYKAKDQGS